MQITRRTIVEARRHFPWTAANKHRSILVPFARPNRRIPITEGPFPPNDDVTPTASANPEQVSAHTNAPTLVDVDDVTKRFGPKTALRDISFAVPAGQICGLLGPNGAGKTTLFRLLMGILKPTSGRLLVDGRDAFEDRVEVKRLIGFLPDEPIFYSYLSGREILELSAAMHGLGPKETLDRLGPTIAQLRLA